MTYRDLEDRLLEECLDEVGAECEEWCHGHPFYEDCIEECLQDCINEKKKKLLKR